jgi:flavin-dependent dehydrogenase
MYDIVVVGARCAGASAAMLLARAGYRVLLLDRARFPSDTLSTLYIHQPGVARLSRWGVLRDLIASGCPPLDRAVYRVADVCLDGCAPPVEGIRAGYAPRRQVLDAVLVQAAVTSGAELREGCAAVDLLAEDGRVVGVRYRLPSGKLAPAPARLTIGADGMRSLVARVVGAVEYAGHRRMTCAYYSYWSDVPADFEWYQRPGRWVAALRTHDDLTLVAAYFPQDEFGRVRAAATRAYLENVRTTAPQLFERTARGRRVGRLYGTGDQRNFFRQAWGPGWVLVGDAGHHKDSLTAQGISDAFLQADLLVDCLTRNGAGGADILEDQPRLERALERFARERDRLLEPGYQTTLVATRLQVEPERLSLLRAIQRSPELTERYFGTVAGILTPQELYTHELLALLMPPRGAAADG